MKHLKLVILVATVCQLAACVEPELEQQKQEYDRILEAETFFHLSCDEIGENIDVVERYMLEAGNFDYDPSQDVGDFFAQAGEFANQGQRGAANFSLASGLLVAGVAAYQQDRTKQMAEKGSLLWNTSRSKQC